MRCNSPGLTSREKREADDRASRKCQCFNLFQASFRRHGHHVFVARAQVCLLPPRMCRASETQYGIYDMSLRDEQASGRTKCMYIITSDQSLATWTRLQRNLPPILIIQNNPRSYFSFLKPYPSFYTRIWIRGMELKVSDTITPATLAIATIPAIHDKKNVMTLDIYKRLTQNVYQSRK